MIKRRAFLGILAGGVLSAGSLRAVAQGARHPLWPLWEAWRSAHVDFTGRVIDGPQNRASHSEGQGYGMLLAAEMGDGDAFRRMADWTDINLAIRGDALLAWRWLPDAPGRVPDLNNASDGDLFYAWALVRAAARFGDAGWLARAEQVARDLSRKCVAARPDRPDAAILMPAAQGFTNARGLVVNPSYMMPRALREVAEATNHSRLADAGRGGLSLMAEMATVGLVPDWLELTPAGPAPAPGFSFNAGYEALRVPLFLAWSGQTAHPALRRAVTAMAGAPPGRAATVLDRVSGDIMETSADPGYRATPALLDCIARGGTGAMIPPFVPTQPYYPATLHMFALLAQTGLYPKCVPI